jgi:hypothetical protein
MAALGVGECMKSSGVGWGRKGNAYWVRFIRLLRLSRERTPGDRRRLCCRFEGEKRVETSALRGWKLNNNNSIAVSFIHLIYVAIRLSISLP